MPIATFDLSIPVELQLNDYSCSVGATYWCLQTLGFTLMQRDLESLMVPGLVSGDRQGEGRKGRGGRVDSPRGLYSLSTSRHGCCVDKKPPPC